MEEEAGQRILLLLVGLGFMGFGWFIFELRLAYLPEAAMFAWVKLAVLVAFGLFVALAALLPPHSEFAEDA